MVVVDVMAIDEDDDDDNDDEENGEAGAIDTRGGAVPRGTCGEPRGETEKRVTL